MTVRKFNQQGDFQAYYAAEKFCRESGYSVGSMCAHEPTGLMKGDLYCRKVEKPHAKRATDG